MSFENKITEEKAEEYKQMILSGESVMVNCNLGFMIEITRNAESRFHIECPMNAYGIRGEAEAEHVKNAIASWSNALDAWNRLN